MIKCFSLNEILPKKTENDDEHFETEEDDLEINDSECSASDSEYSDSDLDSQDSITSEDDDDEDHEEPLPKDFTAHFGCVPHTLQLGINGSLKEDEAAKSFILYINNLMVFFKKSTRWSDELKKITKTDVILPAKTRWNAILDMLNRFQEVNFI